MKRMVLLTALVLLVSGFAAAQGGDQAPTDTGPQNGVIPDLPSQASDVAQQVTDTINQFLSGGIDSLGNALQSLLGGGQAANITEQ